MTTRHLLLTVLLMASLSCSPVSAKTAVPVVFLPGGPAQIPNAPEHSEVVDFTMDAGILWLGSRGITNDSQISDALFVLSSQSECLYISLRVPNAPSTSLAEVVSTVERLRRIAQKKTQRDFRIEIVVWVPDPVKLKIALKDGEHPVRDGMEENACSKPTNRRVSPGHSIGKTPTKWVRRRFSRTQGYIPRIRIN
ncbi:MAG: hypothetical protein JW818_14400 [Pirellulales bacterium]|nr:hypothetical protein [Pirellulales bacterium]